jgi:hypothetical protein
VAAFCTPKSTSTSTPTSENRRTSSTLPLPSLSGLQAALDELVREEAVLNARILGWETTRARWGPLNLDSIEVEGLKRDCEVVLDKRFSLSEYGIAPKVTGINTDEDKSDENEHSDLDSEKLGKIMSHLLQQETETARRELNVETGDLWRVIRIVTPDSNSESAGFVVLVVHHIITDGMGGLEFFSQLLQRALRHDQEQKQVRVQGQVEGDMETQPLLRSSSESELQTQVQSTEPTSPHKPITTTTTTSTKMRPLPPALESTIRLKPALSTLLRAVWYELLVPKFPGWLQRFFVDENAAKVWIGRSIAGRDNGVKVKAAKRDGNEVPNRGDVDVEIEGGGQSVDLATLPCHYSVVPLPAELIGRLVRLSAARHQARSSASRVKLTSLLMAALMLAVHSTLDEQAIKDGVNIEGNVPMSERNLELGHPTFLGNLMVPAMYRKWFPAAAEGERQKTEEERYWDVAEDLAERLENGQMRTAGREQWGLTAHIPDGKRQKLVPPQNPTSDSTTRVRGAFTGWEEYFGADHRRTKYPHSVQFSNLGRVPPSFPKVDAVAWGHPAACFDSHAVEVDCVGLAGGEVWMSVNWRDGSMVDGVLIERIIKEMKALLCRLVEGSA